MLGIGEKFLIICPNCGNYAEASKGLFKRTRKIKCPGCSEEIIVNRDRFTSVECSHCHNIIMYDQSDESPVCPVCKEPVNVKIYKDGPAVRLRCPECGFSLLADRKDAGCICPVCENEINIQLEIQKEEALKEGLISVIEFKGDPNVLVWKHKNENFAPGSRLIVHESQEAIFFKDGRALDTFPSGQYTLDTDMLPQEMTQHALSNGDISFRAEVYFVSMLTVKGIKWGTPEKINYMDPATHAPVSIGASGSYDIRIVNSRKILAKLVGTTDVLLAAHVTDGDQIIQGRDLRGAPAIREYFRDTIINNVKRFLPAAIKEDNIDLFEIDEHLYDISCNLRSKINEALDEYGIDCPQFIVSRISTPEEDPDDPAHDDFVYRKRHYREKYKYSLEREKEKQLEQERFEDNAAWYEKQQTDTEIRAKVSEEPEQFVAAPDMTWDCSVCGTKNLNTRFCPNCGNRRPEKGENVICWDCECGAKKITSKFCPECGKKRPESPDSYKEENLL